MTWVRIDDDFEDNAKVEPLSDSAHRLWMMANCWCKKKKNFHTRGFVPAALLPTITHNKYKPSTLAKLVQELVDAKAGGTKKHGLWEPREGGWQFHDWERYLSKEDLEPDDTEPTVMTRQEAARVAGLRSAEVRRERNGTAQPGSTRTNSNVVRERSANDVRRTDPEPSRTEPEPPDPDPVPIRTDNSLQDLEAPEQTEPERKCAIRDPFGDSFIRVGAEEQALFEAYREESGKTGVRFDDNRPVFLKCVRDGVVPEQVRAIVRGAKKEPFAVARGLVPSLLLGTSGQRTKYLALEKAPANRANQPPQPNDESNRYQPRVIR